jgi:preprotein translocase subunit SecA
MFTAMMDNIKESVIAKTFHVKIENKEDVQRIAMPRRTQKVVEGRGAMGGGMREAPQKQRTVKRDMPKVGRNDPCPCGSGKKYKKCCGKTA